MKKTLFLAVALLTLPVMVRAEGCCPTKVRDLVTKYVNYLAAGALTGAVTTANPNLVKQTGLDLKVLSNETVVSLLGTELTHLAEGNSGVASLQSYVAFLVGQYLGQLGYGLVTTK